MTANLVVDALNMAAWTRRHLTFDSCGVTPTPDHNTFPSPTPTDTRSGGYRLDRPVAISFDKAMAESMFALFKTELFRNPAVSRASAATGRGSTTSSSRPPSGSRGSTRSDSTEN